MRIVLSMFTLACVLAGAITCGAGMTRTDHSIESNSKQVDTIYHNGNIYTMTETPATAQNTCNANKAEAIVTRDGQIIFIGTKSSARKRGYFEAASQIVDLKGKTLLPGFVDGHGHFPEQGQYDLYEINLNSRPLGPMTSISDYQQALGLRCETENPGSWIIGWGYDDTSITDLRHPTRQDIDAICPNNPVYLRHISGHMGVANSKALQIAGITPSNPEKFHTEGVTKDKDGQATGLLMETKAMGLITSLSEFPRYDPQKTLARANHVYAAAGVTTADQGASMVAIHLPLFQSGLALKNLSLRVILHPLAVYEQIVPEKGIIDMAGWMNRAALGWRAGNRYSKSGQERLLFADASTAVKTGDDITQRPVAVYDINTHTQCPYFKTNIPVPKGLPSGMLFLGAWKLLFDGSPQGYTAWLKSPGYYNWGNYTAADSFDGAPFFNGAQGTLNINTTSLERLLELYHRSGQSTETHTNGNAAAEAWVTAIEKVVAAHPNIKDTRHTAIHAQMIELQHIQRMTGNYKDLAGSAFLYSDLSGAFTDGRLTPEKVGASSISSLSRLMKAQNLFNSYFIDHVYFWGDRHRNIFMGPGRANNMSPVGWSVHYGQPYGFHSDTFVTPIHPMRSVQTAVTRTSAPTPLSSGGTLISGTGKNIQATVKFPARDPSQVKGPDNIGIFPNYDQRINVLQALLGVTRFPAWQNKLDNHLGSLQEGLNADFVILDRDPFLVANQDAQKLANIRVMSTIVEDRVIYGFLPGTRLFASAPVPAYIQNEEIVITMLDNSPLDTTKAIPTLFGRNEKLLGAYFLRAIIQGRGTALFQMDILGNGGRAEETHMFRLSPSEQITPFIYSASGQVSDASYWIAPLSNPTLPLQPGETLEMDAPYIVFFKLGQKTMPGGTVQEQAQIILTTSGALPTNGGTT